MEDENGMELAHASMYADGYGSVTVNTVDPEATYTSITSTVATDVQTTVGTFTLSNLNLDYEGITSVVYDVEASVNGTVIDPTDYDLTVAFDTVTTPRTIGVIVTCGHYADTTFDFSICGTVYRSGGEIITYTDWLNITGIQYIDMSLNIIQPANKQLDFNSQTTSRSLTCVYTPEDATVSNLSISCATIPNLSYSSQSSGDPGEFIVTVQNPLNDDPTLTGSHTCVLELDINGHTGADTFTINFVPVPASATLSITGSTFNPGYNIPVSLTYDNCTDATLAVLKFDDSDVIGSIPLSAASGTVTDNIQIPATYTGYGTKAATISIYDSNNDLIVTSNAVNLDVSNVVITNTSASSQGTTSFVLMGLYKNVSGTRLSASNYTISNIVDNNHFPYTYRTGGITSQADYCYADAPIAPATAPTSFTADFTYNGITTQVQYVIS